MQEIYIDIKNYEGLYQISNFGNVKSLPKGDGNGNRERLLKLELCKKNHTNYYRVTLSKKGEVKRFLVHRLVASHFLPMDQSKQLVNHIDNNGTNNHISNLEYCTHVENMEHSSSQGRQDLTRVLGGLAAGKLKQEKSFITAQSRIGETLGNLLITNYILDTTLKKPRLKFICKCTCGNTTMKTAYKLKVGTLCCKECSYKFKR